MPTPFGWNVETASAVATAAGAIAAAYAAWTAVKLGRKQIDLENQRKSRRVIAATGQLLHELIELKSTAEQLSIEDGVRILLYSDDVYALKIKSLSSNSLQLCVAESEHFPETAVRMLVATFVCVGTLKKCIDALHEHKKYFDEIPEQIKGIRNEFDDLMSLGEADSDSYVHDQGEFKALEQKLLKIQDMLSRIESEHLRRVESKLEDEDKLYLAVTEAAKRLVESINALDSYLLPAGNRSVFNATESIASHESNK